jgi:predicted DNA-binding transcriptional regulator AlpA
VSASASPFLTEHQLAARWQITDRSVRRLVAGGDLVPVRIGPQTVRFRLEDVEAFETARKAA